MSRPLSSRIAAIVVAAALASCAAPTSQEPGGPSPRGVRPANVLLVSIDTLRADHVSEAPYLSRLAAAGRSFSSMYASASWTLPSHVSLFTSTPYLEHDVPPPGSSGTHPGARIPAAATTLASVLAASGFATAATTEGGWILPVFGLDQGFERFATEKPMSQGGSRVLEAHLAWIRDFLGGERRPFFLFVHTYWVHDYFVNSAEYHEFVTADEERFTRLGNLLRNVDARERKAIPPSFVRRLYAAGVRRADRFVEDVVDTVLEATAGAPILVVVTSDHGECLGEAPGEWGHGWSLEENQIRIPLIAWSNAGEALRGRVDVAASTIDVAPSVLRWLGFEVPEAFRGSSDRFLAGTPAPSVVLSRHVATDRERPSQGTTSQALVSRGWKYLRTDSFDGHLLAERCVDLAFGTADASGPECARLSEVYERLEAAHARRVAAAPAGPATPDPELRKQLQALGYAE